MSPEEPGRYALRRSGCRVRVHLAIGEAHRRVFESIRQPPPPPLPLLGILDTGADNVAVKRGTFAAMGVSAVQPVEVRVAHGEPTAWPAYTGRLVFSPGVIVPCLAVEMLNPDLPFDCIIGRDILAHGEFHYFGSTGRCSLRLQERDIELEPPG